MELKETTYNEEEALVCYYDKQGDDQKFIDEISEEFKILTFEWRRYKDCYTRWV